MARETSDAASGVVRALRTLHGLATDLDQQFAVLSGLSLWDMRCLDLLDLHDGRMTAGALAEATGLTTGAITGVVDRLERVGVANRVPDEDDRRRVFVQLDEDRRALGRSAHAALVDAELEHLSHLDAHDLAVLRAFLEAEIRWTFELLTELRARGRPTRRS